MKKGVVLIVSILFILASGVFIFAQTTGQSPPGYGGWGPWWMMGQTPYPHPHMMGPHIMGPGMMGSHMMGPGMMGPGWGQYYATLTPEEAQAQAKAFVEEYIRLYLPGYELKKRSAE